MMFIGEKFCSHCGAKAERTEVSEAATELCPRCKVAMEAVVIGKSNLRECPQCEGLWVDGDSLRQICEDREEQAAVLGMASHLPSEPEDVPKKVQYLPCPVCKELMNRVNFANCSHVVVDVCKQHGTWFDHDDLRHIVEFIQAGGLAQSRAREMADLEDERRRVEWQSAVRRGGAGLGMGTTFSPGPSYDLSDLAIGAAGVLLRVLLR
jgi:Zn-finger nucleic acid-binding protein